MQTIINELVYKLLKNQKYSELDTKEFQLLKHNDHLVPKFTKNFEILQRLIGNYYDDCYDIQGISDNGVDILLKYKFDNEYHKIGIQIKSYDDMKNKDWLSKLKAQLFEEQKIWETDDLYIVFCTDSNKHKDKTRNAIAEIQKYSDCKIHIVKPEEAIAFYKFDTISILSKIYDFFHKNDNMLMKARHAFNRFTNEDVKTIIEVIVYQFLNNNESIGIDNITNESCNLLDPFSPANMIDFDTQTLKYRYNDNWNLTNYVVEIKTKFNLKDSDLISFLYERLKIE